jgi:hypothetical protein
MSHAVVKKMDARIKSAHDDVEEIRVSFRGAL